MFVFGNIQNSYVLNKLRKLRSFVYTASQTWDSVFFPVHNMRYEILNIQTFFNYFLYIFLTYGTNLIVLFALHCEEIIIHSILSY